MLRSDGLVVITIWEKHEDSIYQRMAAVLDTLSPGRGRLELQPRFGDKTLKFQVVCPQNGTAVLKGLRDTGKNR